MKRGLSQLCLGRESRIDESLKLCRDLGYDGLEILLTDEGELNMASTASDYAQLKTWSRETGVELCSICAALSADTSFTSDDPKVRDLGIRKTRKMIEAGAALGIHAFLLVPGRVTEEIAYDVAYNRTLEALQEVKGYAEEHRVAIAVENVWNKLFVSPLEVRDFLDKVDSEYVGWFFDVGNVVLFGFPEQWIDLLGHRIKKVHFKDFEMDHRTRTYAWPQLMDGAVNWPKVMAALRRAEYDDYVISEVGGDRKVFAETLRRMDRILTL